MRDKHDLHIAAGTTLTIATIFSAGPSGVIGFFLLAGIGGLGLYAFAEPGIACRQLLYWGETKTIRLTLVCE